MRTRGLLIVSLALLMAGPSAAGTFLSLEKPDSSGLMTAGFELGHAAELRIEAVGLAPRARSSFGLWIGGSPAGEPFLVYSWILDAATRRPVWVMDRGTSPLGGSPRLRRAEGSVRVPAGRYEVYLFSGVGAPPGQGRQRPREPSWWERALDYFSGSEPEQNLDACFISLSVEDRLAREVRRFEVTGVLPGALIGLNRVGDSELRRAGFEFARPSAVRLYGVAEHVPRSRAAADFGWIVDARTRKLVWQSSDGRLPPAGGAEKNRLIDEEIRLGPGRYLLYYGTDDSHSWTAFNANPPHDPASWGVTVLAGKDFDSAGFRSFEPREPEPLVDLTGVGDDASLAQPFRLEREGELHVHALGELVNGSRFVDQAAIVEAGSGRTVWEMTRDNTLPGGGAEKNRMFDGLVRLSRGSYVLRYRTDDSHSHPR
jgi:hypothetical protein